MARNVLILVILPYLIIACTQKQDQMAEEVSPDESAFGNRPTHLSDFSYTDQGCEGISEEAKERKLYETLTKGERKLFHSPDEFRKTRDKTSQALRPGTQTADNYTGIDNILAHFPEYKDMIEKKIKPMMHPETYDTLKLILGCCPEFEFFRRETTLLSPNDENKTLVHFKHLHPPQYQYTFLGMCATEGGLFGDTGHCSQGFTNSFLLVFDSEHKYGVAFDLFRIPSFCKCYTCGSF